MITNLNEFLKKNSKSKVNEDLEPITEPIEGEKTFSCIVEFKIKTALPSDVELLDYLSTMFGEKTPEIFDKEIQVMDITNEGIGSFVSNLVNNDKKMGEVLTKNLAVYIKSKPSSFTFTSEDMTKAFELAKAAEFYTKNITFENDAQKQAWDYLKQRAQKSMNFSAAGPINPAS